MMSFSVHGPAHPTVPLLVTIPHVGTAAPADVESRWTEAARRRPDTDWHLDQLYDFVPSLGAQMMVAHHSRYVVDLNRPVDGGKLYPGRSETGLVPTTTFADEPIYLPGQQPTAQERQERIATHWQPWHHTVQQKLHALRAQFGHAILFDAHSIVSVVPRFFEGALPGLMLGTVDGKSCSPHLAALVGNIFTESPYDWALNAPFKGGHITRSFGAPADNIHALQLEMSQRLYMEEQAPFRYLPERAARLKPWLQQTLAALAAASHP